MTRPIAPHPALPKYYETDADRPRMVRDLFDEAAPYYEWVCRAMSFGSGEWYRGRVLVNAGLAPGWRLLDVATGTGLVLRSARTICGPRGLAIGLDPSPGMLRQCRTGVPDRLVRGTGERLPFADESFDMVSMGYALRHVTDLRLLFGEFHRVLAPGGRVVVLELTQPRSAAGRWFNRIYMGSVVPRVAQVGTGSVAARRMMEYFWETIEHCVPPATILDALRDSGFRDVRRRVMGSVLSEYLAARPS